MGRSRGSRARAAEYDGRTGASGAAPLPGPGGPCVRHPRSRPGPRWSRERHQLRDRHRRRCRLRGAASASAEAYTRDFGTRAFKSEKEAKAFQANAASLIGGAFGAKTSVEDALDYALAESRYSRYLEFLDENIEAHNDQLDQDNFSMRLP
jgi:hypothetical protein